MSTCNATQDPYVEICEVPDMKKLRVLIFALGLAMPMLAGAVVDRYVDADRSIVQGSTPSAYCWVCMYGICFWAPC